MRPALQRLFLHWTLIALTLALVAVGAIGLWGSGLARDQIAQEKSRTAAVIGTALANDLSQALGQGIPIEALVGVDDWFADALKGSPSVLALALQDARGESIAQSGLPEELASPLRAQRRAGESLMDRWSVVTMPVAGGPEGLTQGWLHVVVPSDPHALAPWLGSVAILLAAGLIAALALRLMIHQRLEQALLHLRRGFEAIARGDSRVELDGAASGPVASLTRELQEHLDADAERRARFLQKAAEVRAAHFDPEVIARIDTITRPWQASEPQDLRDALHGPRRAPGRLGLAGRLGAAGVVAWVAILALSLAVADALQESDHRQLLRHARELLGTHLALVREFERDRLQAAVDAIAQDATVRAALEASRFDEVAQRMADLRPDDVTVSVLGADAQRLAVWPPGQFHPQPDRSALPAPGAGAAVVHDYWQDADGRYQSGLVRALAGHGGEVRFLVATRSLEHSRAELERRLGAAVALIDLRDRPIGDANVRLVEAWRAQHRQEGLLDVDGASGVLAALPLETRLGVPLAGFLAALPRDTGSGPGERLQMLVGGAGLLATLIALLLFIRRSLQPLAVASDRLAELAVREGDVVPTTAVTGPPRLTVGGLESSVAKLQSNIEALAALRRARARQGRRQARFMRHQMLQLAQRLDEKDREAILSELERLESASRPPEPLPHPGQIAPPSQDDGRPTVLSTDQEQVVDSIGVLALGFQGLLGRVGDQYEQLSKLVEELREALRVKTQFISLQRDLEIAAKIQLSFVPRKFDLCTEVEMLGAYRPAKEVGGDFYDLFRLGEHHLGLTIADVSGKGIPAALFMAVSRTLLRAVSQIEEAPADRIARLNDLLAGNNSESMFVTLFYAVLDLRDGSVTYTNAGHNPPYVLRRDGQLEPLPSSHGMALGILDGLSYTQQHCRLAPGEALFLFTDGVTEAFNPQGEMFGEDRLEALLGRVGSGPVDAIPEAVLEAVKTFEDGGPQSDDVTCLVARYLGTGA